MTVIHEGATPNKGFIRLNSITFSSAAQTVVKYDYSLSTNQLREFSILLCCSDMLFSHTHNIPFTVIQWKRTFVSHHAGGLKSTSQLTHCNCHSRIDSMYRQQKQTKLIISHVLGKECLTTLDKQLLFPEMPNTDTWCHSLIERCCDRLPFAWNNVQRLSESSDSLRSAETLCYCMLKIKS